MMWFVFIVIVAAGLALAGATVRAVREGWRRSQTIRLECRLDPRDVFELDQACARVQREVLFGD
jgi:hypothetical protein